MITVSNQIEDSATVYSYRELAVGSRIKFETNYGLVVQQYNNGYYGVQLSNSDPITTGEPITWWKISQPSFEILVPQSFFIGQDKSTFKAQCVTSRDLPISWQLFYGSTEIIKGNDALCLTYCKAHVKGLFPAGVYCLKATQYLNQSPIKQAKKSWTLEVPTSEIDCGMGKALSAVNLV